MSRYEVWVLPQVWKEIKNLPGNMRQRVKKAVDLLSENSKPSNSKKLDLPDYLLDFESELHRIRIESWRIVYAISETDNAIDVLGVRKRPPYDYEDLEKLLKEVL